MTVSASSTRSSYDFTFALPSAFYEPILAILCHRNTIQFHHDTILFCTCAPGCLAFPLPHSSVPLVFYAFLLHCYSWALLIITITALAVSFPWLSHNAAILFYAFATLSDVLPLPFIPTPNYSVTHQIVSYPLLSASLLWEGKTLLLRSRWKGYSLLCLSL